MIKVIDKKSYFFLFNSLNYDKPIIAQNANNMYQVFLFSVNFEIPLVTEADLQITGNNIENRMGYIENEKYLNKTFQHIYQVSKSLSTPISGVTLEVRN